MALALSLAVEARNGARSFLDCVSKSFPLSNRSVSSCVMRPSVLWVPMFLGALVGCAGLLGIDRDYTVDDGADASIGNTDARTSQDARGAPSSDGPTSSAQCEGGSCACAGGQSCKRTCKGPGCAFVCDGSTSCFFECEKGSCTIETSAQSKAVVDCSSGGCTGVASNQSSLIVSCRGGNCSFQGHNGAILSVSDCRGNNCRLECDNTASCQLQGCSADCSSVCAQTSTCSNDCTASSCR
jgi:hypothetical protein